MTHVRVNNEDCTVQVKGDFVIFLYTTAARDPIHIGARTVSQLLRSRKDDTAAKIVADNVSYVLKFESLHDRETLVDAIVRIQEAPAEASSSHEDWVTSSICHAAVDVGVLDPKELETLVRADGQRGVEQAFEALEGLVDRDTFELKPITEQMENDVLRQIPILAAIFADRVVDTETKKAFWEAVVRKYFCFSRTFLEEDIQRREAAATATATAAVTAVAPDSLSAINASSLNALPKGAAVSMVDTDVHEEDLLLQLDDAAAPDENALEVFFGAREKVHDAEQAQCPINSTHLLLFPEVSMWEMVAPRSRFMGRRVLHQFPTEPIEKSALEILRVFWRSGTKQRKAMLVKYNSAKRVRTSFIQRMCLEKAEHTVQEEESAHQQP